MKNLEEIRTKDGYKISLTNWVPEHSNNKIMIIGTSIAVTQAIYEDFAEYFCKQGFHVYSFDYRGIGRSAPKKLRNFRANLYQWATVDLDAILLHIKHRFPKKEIIFLGHGLSGEIVGLAPASQYINRMVMLNSTFTSERFRPLAYRIWMKGILFLGPILVPFFGYFPGKLLRFLQNVPLGVMHQLSVWYNNHNGLFDHYSDHNFRKLKMPILALHVSDDWLTPPFAAIALLERFPNASIKRLLLTPKQSGTRKLGHSGYFSIRQKSTLWLELIDWMNASEKPALPSFSS